MASAQYAYGVREMALRTEKYHYSERALMSKASAAFPGNTRTDDNPLPESKRHWTPAFAGVTAAGTGVRGGDGRLRGGDGRRDRGCGTTPRVPERHSREGGNPGSCDMVRHNGITMRSPWGWPLPACSPLLPFSPGAARLAPSPPLLPFPQGPPGWPPLPLFPLPHRQHLGNAEFFRLARRKPFFKGGWPLPACPP